MNKVKLDFSKMESDIKREAAKAAERKMYEVSCKNFHTKVTAPVWKSTYPCCGKEINLTLDIH